jgi:hypothetical protein
MIRAATNTATKPIFVDNYYRNGRFCGGSTAGLPAIGISQSLGQRSRSSPASHIAFPHCPVQSTAHQGVLSLAWDADIVAARAFGKRRRVRP